MIVLCIALLDPPIVLLRVALYWCPGRGLLHVAEVCQSSTSNPCVQQKLRLLWYLLVFEYAWLRYRIVGGVYPKVFCVIGGV